MMYKDLGDKLEECGAINYGDYSLTSEIKSNYYIDIKKAISKPEILDLIRKHIVDIVDKLKIKTDYIACIELGAVPICTAVSLATGKPTIIVRKARKEYGIKNRIIGDIEKGKTALFVEDVTTTGGSILNAVQILRDEGLFVQKVISVVDRDEGAEEALEKEGLVLISLVKAKMLLDH